jgi:DNA-binding XRE family transcriptional regulator
MQAGKKIKMLRALKGLTQDELAAKINKNRGPPLTGV